MSLHVKRVVVVGLAAVISASATAFATDNGSTSSSSTAPEGANATRISGEAPKYVTASPIDAVPEVQSRAFAVLRNAAVATVPERVRDLTNARYVKDRFAPNPSLARASTAGSNGIPWYVIPGDKSLCLTIPDGTFTCATEQDALAGRLFVMAARSGGSVSEAESVSQIIYGVAPDGVTSVRAETNTGASVSADVVDNLYEIHADSVTALVLDGGDEESMTVRLAPR